MSKPAPRKPLTSTRKPLPAPTRKPGQPSSRAGVNAKSADEGYLYLAGVKDPSKRMVEFRTEHDVCPVCHTDRQFNKNLRLMVSPCYHKMCESCIDRLFTLGPEPCPACGKILRKVNFGHQTFEALEVEKEVSIRRRMAEHFNKREMDFGGKREYDNYLEEVEDLTFNLLNNIDLVETEARISEFTKKNAQLIAENQQKTALEALSQTERDEVEKRAREERMRMVEEAERIDREEDVRVKREVTDALARGSQETADDIKYRAELSKRARADALDRAIPASLAAIYHSTQPSDDDNAHPPTSPSYSGPFVAFPYSDPDKVEWKDWYEMKEDYVDGRGGVFEVKEDKDGRVRGGGFDLGLFWEMEIRAAVEGLGVERLV